MDGKKACDYPEKSSAEKYREFRKVYPEFIYRGYQVEDTDDAWKICYDFEIPGLAEFHPAWKFPKRCFGEGKRGGKRDERLLDKMIFSLGMVELVSYWKITCSPKVVVRAGRLDAEQILWWKNLYFHGLGEFFYVNRIDEAGIEDFMEIAAELPEEGFGENGLAAGGQDDGMRRMEENGDVDEDGEGQFGGSLEKCRVLVPIGGGKDSAVTLELLKEAKADIWGYVINPRGATVKTAEVAGIEEGKRVYVGRTLDKEMLELNRKGFLNGHTPFSAIVAFSSLLAAKLYGIPFIALSNESSANESTVQGSTVNHQYSKSFRFEKDFHEYVRRYLPGGSYYFSMLRPLSEFQIAGYFSACKEYHSVFRSCNVGSKKDAWCGHCPKCLFVAAILSPFLSEAELEGIWGRNLLDDESLWGTLEQLIGIQEEKPFECVGSRREVNAALALAVERFGEGERLPKLLEDYRTTPQYEAARRLGDVYSNYFDEDNLVPGAWKELVRRRCTGRRVK